MKFNTAFALLVTTMTTDSKFDVLVAASLASVLDAVDRPQTRKAHVRPIIIIVSAFNIIHPIILCVSDDNRILSFAMFVSYYSFRCDDGFSQYQETRRQHSLTRRRRAIPRFWTIVRRVNIRNSVGIITDMTLTRLRLAHCIQCSRTFAIPRLQTIVLT